MKTVKIINTTKSTIIAERAFKAEGLLSRLKGLLGQKALLPGGALILSPCKSIHTLFMQFPIDVIFTNRNNVVVKVLSDLVPFRLSGFYPASYQVIELPAETVAKSNTKVGDLILLIS